MIRVNNNKTIKHVADISFRADVMRNIFAVVAIALTTVLFCGLFTITSSLINAVEESTMRQVGGRSHSGLKYLTMEQYETIKKHPDIKEITYSVVLGVAENKELEKRPTEIRYVNDKMAADMFFSLPTKGKLPEKENEIAADTLVLEKLGVPAKLGEKVTLEYSINGEKYKEIFVLTGFWEGDIIIPASQIWLDREYVENVLSGYDADTLEYYVGKVFADINFSNSWNIEQKIIKVIEESGYKVGEIDYGINWAYTGGNTMDMGMIAGAGMVIMAIIFCGYLMISNVFLISVTRDVRFYGLLKTIGTTGKQIKMLIRRQAVLISLIGIPIGMVLGSLVGRILTPFVLGILNVNVVTVKLRLWVFAFSAIFALLTVFISIHKASKLASKVSPIEALKITDATSSSKKNKKSRGKISLWKMAAENVGRNRKKVVFVTISLSLSMVILNASYSMANSFDMDKYLSRMISHDFVMGDIAWFNVYLQYSNQDTLSKEFVDTIAGFEGVESLERIYFSEKNCNLDVHWDDIEERAATELGIQGSYLEYLQEDLEDGMSIWHVYGLDDPVWDDLSVWEGEIDLEKLYSGDYVVVSPFDSEGRVKIYEVGDSIEVFSADGESRVCEVLAIATIPYNISIPHSHPLEISIFVPTEVFLNKVEQKSPMLVTLDVEDSQIGKVEQYLSDYGKEQDDNLQYTSKAVVIKEYEDTQRTYRLVGLVAGVLLALIGIANFANTCITSIMARKRELAMLQSIGMTVRQQRIMLVTEGVIYMILCAVCSWTVGSVLARGSLELLLGSEYYTIQFTIIPSVICMPVLFLISIVIPVLSQKYANRESVVERLRRVE